MNDPIINLLKEWKQRGIIATPEDIAKQIRQQIGRELIERRITRDIVTVRAIREVLQMDEGKE